MSKGLKALEIIKDCVEVVEDMAGWRIRTKRSSLSEEEYDLLKEVLNGESAFIIVKDFKGLDYYFGGYDEIDNQDLKHYNYELSARFYRDLKSAYKFKTRAQAKKAASDIVGAKVISLFKYIKGLN